MSSFRPRMEARRSGIEVLGEPLSHASEIGLVEIWRARCAAGANGDYVSRDPRLFIVLDPLDAEMALDGGPSGGRAASRTRSASFVPAGAPLHMSLADATEIRHLDIHFDADRLGPVDGLDEARAATPRLMFADGRVQRFARLLETAFGGSRVGLYRDGLVAALIAAVFAPSNAAGRRSALSDAQLRLAIEFIEDNCAETVRLHDLAALTGLSETYFSHAFKAASGMPPHRWQLQARVRRAKELLARSAVPLIEIAGAVGFSDQPHFTRVFRELAGRTPAAWRAQSR
ncbi:helix-turn-helix transcriptional regulator [Hansschlegelia zhihuaiae]|uniref:helix-turn-helix transcriptional regulator n=1 Tax=Hansschlegelia zhihuaiae TaxID=405005 RepID=UPI0013E8B191|nr:AraC family transcriptional regulator [Hansschlegelia zhihuaiae]